MFLSIFVKPAMLYSRRGGAMLMTEADELLTVPEVAAQLKAHPETVRGWLKTGRLRGVKPAGDKFGWRVRASEITRFLGEPDQAGAED
jgi:excisionase family DNA binding protein